MSSILVAAPPRDTPFFDKRTGRVSEAWLTWFGSITATATIVQNLQVSNVVAEDNSTDGNSSEILAQVTDLLALLAEPRRAPDAPAVDLLPALDAPVNAWRGECDELRAMIAAGLEANQAWRTEADELRTLIAAGDPAPFGALGSAAFQPATAFDPAGAWSLWTGAVNANSNDLSNVYILGTAGLQVSAFATIGGSLNYTNGAATYMTSNNAGSGAWNEFSYYLQPGAALANDQFWIAVNSRTTAGGTDSYSPAMQIAALTGQVTFPNQVTFTAAPVFTNAAGTRTALGLGTAATQASTAFDAAGTAAAVQSASIQKANNLSDVANASSALTNLVGVWQSWTPTVTASGSMTVSGVTISDAQYITIAGMTFFKLLFSCTLAGTAGNTVFATMPANGVGAQSNISCGFVQGSNLQTAFGNKNTATQFAISCIGTGAFTLGSIQFWASGFYRTT